MKIDVPTPLAVSEGLRGALSSSSLLTSCLGKLTKPVENPNFQGNCQSSQGRSDFSSSSKAAASSFGQVRSRYVQAGTTQTRSAAFLPGNYTSANPSAVGNCCLTASLVWRREITTLIVPRKEPPSTTPPRFLCN